MIGICRDVIFSLLYNVWGVVDFHREKISLRSVVGPMLALMERSLATQGRSMPHDIVSML